MKIIILNLVIYSISFFSYSQEKEYLVGTISKVISTKEYVLVDKDNNEFYISLNDIELSKDQNLLKESIDYVKNKILFKNVYFFVEENTKEHYLGTILYNYTNQDGEFSYSTGNVLNVELIVRKYVNYIGGNDFLIMLGNGTD